MEFTVPQFIEKKAKIVGPFTFSQFLFIGLASGICLFLYFVLPLAAFIITSIILLGGGFALAFVKINRTSLPVFIKNFFIFLFKPKIYLWRKKTMPLKVFEKEKVEEKKIKTKEESPLKIAKGSQLGDLFTSLETKNK